MPNRIQLTDSVLDIIAKLSQGNPGAVSVVAQWIADGPGIDPDACHPMIQMCSFDDMDIVGSKIWVLYKDVCGEDLRVFLGVLRAHQLGYLSERDLKWADRDHPLNVAALMERVEAFLPNFKKGEPAAAIQSATGAER